MGCELKFIIKSLPVCHQHVVDFKRLSREVFSIIEEIENNN